MNKDAWTIIMKFIISVIAVSLILWLTSCTHPYPYRQPPGLKKAYREAMEWVEQERQRKEDEKHAIDLLRHMGLEPE